MSAGATVATIVAGKQEAYLRRFREANATDVGQAKSLEELACSRSVVFQGLVDQGVFVEASPGQYYLDVEAAESLASRRRKAVLIMMVLAGVVALVVLSTR